MNERRHEQVEAQRIAHVLVRAQLGRCRLQARGQRCGEHRPHRLAQLRVLRAAVRLVCDERHHVFAQGVRGGLRTHPFEQRLQQPHVLHALRERIERVIAR